MKKIITIFAFIVVFFSGINAIEAFSDTIIVNSQGVGLTAKLNGDKKIEIIQASSEDTYAFFHIKNSNVGEIICTSGFVPSPTPNTKCSATSFSNDNQKKGVAHIINIINGTNGTLNEKYWWTEFLINSYLGNYTYKDRPTSDTYKNIINSSSKILDTNMSYSQIMTEATNKASATYKDINLSLSTTDISFTKNADGYYYSNKVTITTNGGYNINLNNSKFEYDCNDSKECIFKIKESDIAPGSTENLTVTVSSKESPQTYYIAQNYDCGASVQNVTPMETQAVTTTVDSSKTAKGSVTAPLRGKLIINKYDENNNPVIGATILVTSRTDSNIKKTFITDGNPIILDNLELGKYSIDEEIAPAGYLKAEGQIVNLSENNLEATINLIDKSINISILKVNDAGKALEGSKLQLLDKDGNIVEICGDTHNNKCEWVSTNKPYTINLIPIGTYYVKEISVPKGYSINPNKIKIEISSLGEVKVDGKVVKDATVKVLNSLTRTQISKINAVNSQELPGATLQILNNEKESMSCLIINDEGKEETIKPCKWISGNKPRIILGLASGSYYLEEIIAPEGYELNKNMVEFKVKSNGDVTKVEMKNELIVEVPNTLSARSTLLIAISMFDIALGIGIITYVKKNKVEE